MSETQHIDPQEIFALLIFILLAYFIVRSFTKKKITSSKTVKNIPSNFKTQLINELEFNYRIKEKGNTIIINHNDFENSIINGELMLLINEKDKKATIEITYKRSLKFSGVMLTFLSLLLCYIGVLIPISTVQNTKKKTLNTIENIFQTIKSIINN